MSSVALATFHAAPLSRLSEDELMFRDTVRQFASEIIGPLVRKMDEEQHFHPSLLPQLFNLGLMGIEIPTDYAGSGGTLFDAILDVHELSG
jgi:butyryl-CoA dehydrogenase/short/branched chain acyl-CoA dehydrogenase